MEICACRVSRKKRTNNTHTHTPNSISTVILVILQDENLKEWRAAVMSWDAVLWNRVFRLFVIVQIYILLLLQHFFLFQTKGKQIYNI